MLNADLKDVVLSRILPNVKTPAQYLGGELNSTPKDHRERPGDGLPGLPRHLRAGDEPPRAPGALQPDERLRLGVRARLHAAARLRGGPPDARAPALRPRDLHPAPSVRRHRLLAPVRDLLHERADDARPRRAAAPRRGPRGRRHAGDRRRARGAEPRAARPVTSTCSSSATASRACRSSARCGRRCRASPACRATTSWRGSPGASTWAYVPRFYEPEYHPDGTIAGIDRLRDDVPAAIKACVIDDLDGTPLADRADRPVRRDDARPDRHRDHARVPLAVPVLPEHGHQAAPALPDGRDDRQRRPRELPQHRLRRDQPALALDERLSPLRGAGDADERGLHARWGSRSRSRACGSPRCSRRSPRCWPRGGAAG